MTDFKEYASKEWVDEAIQDSLDGAGVHIGPEAPEDTKVHLWVDTNSDGTIEKALGVSF